MSEPPEDEQVVEHDPTGTDYARRIARTVRSTSAPIPQKRRSSAPPTMSGSGADARDPKPAGNVLGSYIADRGWEVSVLIHTILDRWEDIVGPSNAEHSKPETYDDGVLVIRAESTTWSSALKAMAHIIVAKLNESVGDGAVTRVEVRGPDAPTWKHGRLRVKGRGPRDTFG